MDGADVIGHEFGTGRTVEADAEQIDVLERRDEGVGGLAGEHRTHGFDRARDHDGELVAEFVEGLLDADERGFDVARVLAGFDEEDVRAAFGESARLLIEIVNELRKRHAARDRDGFRGGADGRGDEARLVGRGELLRSTARKRRGGDVDLVALAGEAVFVEHERRAAERVGLHDVRTRLVVLAMDIEDHVGPREHEVFVAALERGAAEVIGRKVALLDHRAHRAIKHEDAFVQQ